MVLYLTERQVADPYSKMTDGVGAPVDGLMARGGPGLAQYQMPTTSCYNTAGSSNQN